MARIVLTLIVLSLLLTACGSDQSGNLSIATNNPAVTLTILATIALTNEPTSTLASAPTSAKVPATTMVTKENSTPREWEYLWLKGIPCFAPCWLGITPGQTTLDDAVYILKQSPFVKTESVKVEFNGVSWYWRQGGYAAHASYDSKLNDHIIKSMGGGYYTQFKLGEIIKIYGEPDYINAARTGGIPSIYFYWFSKGFSVGMDGNQFETPPVIDPDLLVGRTLGGPRFFSDRSLEEYTFDQNQDYDIKRFVPWQGYKDFYLYCRDRDKEQACKIH